MTGYGKAQGEINGKKFTVEVRSLNSKQMDLSVKLPGVYRQKEYDLRNLAAKALIRGKADVFINVETDVVSSKTKINSQLFDLYFDQLKQISLSQSLLWDSPEIQASVLSTVMRMPEVVTTEIETIAEEELKILENTVAEALKNINTFRETEGAVLIKDLLKRVDKIESLRQQTAPLAVMRQEVIKTRIREAIEAVGVQVDNNRLEQEIVFYIEKLDVTEEQVRLQNHCKYFHQVVGEDEAVGRKLGFIAQEMGREINTLGSKANDADIQKLVVEMKDELEKIKEQLLNIL